MRLCTDSGRPCRLLRVRSRHTARQVLHRCGRTDPPLHWMVRAGEALLTSGQQRYALAGGHIAIEHMDWQLMQTLRASRTALQQAFAYGASVRPCTVTYASRQIHTGSLDGWSALAGRIRPTCLPCRPTRRPHAVRLQSLTHRYACRTSELRVGVFSGSQTFGRSGGVPCSIDGFPNRGEIAPDMWRLQSPRRRV